MTNPLIDPQTLINQLGVEVLHRNADLYYQKIPRPEYHLGKPFSMPTEASRLLLRLGLILEDLSIGPGSRVLDFGAGTCWLTKALWQLGCDVTGVDVSQTALDLGKRLFEDYPIPMPEWGSWQLKWFDGHRIPVESESIERIVCFDTFHHIPNPDEVIEEFARILTPGGMIAFNEPLGLHSRSDSSQKEMRDYQVLENDLFIEEMEESFKRFGFKGPRFKIKTGSDISIDLEEWKELERRKIPERVINSIIQSSHNNGVFFFTKGDLIRDSRQTCGLKHQFKVESNIVSVAPHEPITLSLKIRNTGSAKWIKGSEGHPGTVDIGSQLVDPETHQFIREFKRFSIPRDIYPDEAIEEEVTFRLAEEGDYFLRFDLVSELVCWFQDLGNQPDYVDIKVRKSQPE